MSAEINSYRDKYNLIKKLPLSQIALGVLSLFFASCKKFVEAEPPKTSVSRSSVFNNDATATAAVAGIYAKMISSHNFISGERSITFFSSLSSDELVSHYSPSSTNDQIKAFYENSLQANNQFVTTNLWSEPYQMIYSANAVIEGLDNNTLVSPSIRKQLTGEAKFIRAFLHFHLINFFGDVPLVTSTDYRKNSKLPRTPKDSVYKQIISDLQEAQSLLSSDYSFTGRERVRPTKWCAMALLSRVYLYINDWPNAELTAGLIIGNSNTFQLESPDKVFLANNAEAIWQLANTNTLEAQTYKFTNAPSKIALRKQLVDDFASNDLRKSNWIGSAGNGMNVYYYSNKYKATSPPTTEYHTVFRLAEQYLIRAEARAKQGKLPGVDGAESDINSIRLRAGLSVAGAVSSAEYLAEIQKQRRFEFFAEWGHRWFDLKRTNKVDEILQPIKPNWNSYKQLFPIPQLQIDNDPGMANAQNPGY